MEAQNGKTTAIEQVAPVKGFQDGPKPTDSPVEHAAPDAVGRSTADEIEEGNKGWFAYIKTRNFWIVLLLGYAPSRDYSSAKLICYIRQVLALCITGTNTFSSLLAAQPFSIPAFQTFWNYILLNIVYTSYTLYKYGWKKYVHLVLHDGWKYIILAFLDVEGNYFTVLAYRYTTIVR